MRVRTSIIVHVLASEIVGLTLCTLQIHSQTTSSEIKIIHRLLAPMRSNPFGERASRPCGLGIATCSLRSEFPTLVGRFEDTSRVVTLELRTTHAGPFCHHWLQTETSIGPVTLGYGPATIPFIDAGQISFQDGHGNVERISGMHPIPLFGLPPLNYHYANPPNSGHTIGKPFHLTISQADALIQKERGHRFVGPYIPFFHDCRTYTCAVMENAKGKSPLSCYLLFKGYW